MSDNLLQTIIPQGIEKEISESYIAYAMSVIVSRALPDTRDGLKPVIRRILYAMHEMKLYHNTKYKKSANVVGEVMGKYHPHGDSSIYDAMVRLAQPFSMRYPLVDGQGNFWSIDGDSPAAMRYTESRLTKIAESMLEDIELDTIDTQPTYDSSRQEPVMLPTRFPNHLCNGTMGIAVGMACNLPPHNLTEVIDATLLLMANPLASLDEIMEIIKGPDFPTGGMIFDPANIKQVYSTGHWSIVMRGKVHIEESKTWPMIVIDEIPYQVNKATLVSKIGELVVDKKIEGIVDLRDASAKDVIKIMIHLRKWINAHDVLTMLYKMTDLQTTFSVNNVTLVDRGIQPQQLNIISMLEEFVAFRREVVLRRSTFLLGKAKDRLHILEWLKRAIDQIDAIIDAIKSSQTKQEAKQKLMSELFDFSDPQSEYILQMRLQSLVGLEIQNIIDEIKEKSDLISQLNEIIENPQRRDEVIKEELEDLKDTYGDERRTEVSNDLSVYALWSSMKHLRDAQDKIKESVILWISNNRTVRNLYQSRINQIPEESLDVIYTHNQDRLIVITDQGELVIERLKDFWSHTMKSPAVDLRKHYWLKGRVIFVNTMEHEYEYLVFLTDRNNCKKIKKELLNSFRKFPTVVMWLLQGEKLIGVETVNTQDYVGVVTKQAMMLIFPEDNLRPMGKTAGGVKAIDLKSGDQVVKLFVYRGEPFVMVYGKQSAKLINIEDFKLRKRARAGQLVVMDISGESIKGAISIVEGAVRMRMATGNILTTHSNDIVLDDLETPMRQLVSGSIDIVYRPREEKEENKRYVVKKSDTEEVKTTEWATQDSWWLF